MRTIIIYMTAAAACAAISVSCSNQSLETTFNNQETKIADYASGVVFSRCTLGQTEDDSGNPMFDDEGNPVFGRTVEESFTPQSVQNGGATRLTIVPGEGTPLTSSGSASVYYAGYVFTSGPSAADITDISLEGRDATWLASTPYSQFTVSASQDEATGNVTMEIGGSGSSSGLSLFATNHYETALLSGWNLSGGDWTPVTVDLGSGDLVEGLQSGLEGVRAGEVCEILFSGKYGLGKKPLGTVPANSALLYRIWVISITE